MKVEPLKSIAYLKPCGGPPEVAEEMAARSYLGTCFSFLQPSVFITAAHCVRNEEPQTLCVVARLEPQSWTYHVVRSIVCHPTADLAMVTIGSPPAEELQPFREFEDVPLNLGMDFIAFGFPSDVFGDRPMEPTPRVFKGHFQRYYRHRSRFGPVYQAGEMSISAPRGLSGGPVFTYLHQPKLVGVVTENMESANARYAEEEISEDGSVTRLVQEKLISYGVCLLLKPLEEWLRSHAGTP